jgi:hypothetical protein
MTAGRAPEKWADTLWERMAKPPFNQEWKNRPNAFIKPYKAKSDIKIENLVELGDDETAGRLLAWLEVEFAKDRFKEARAELADLLSELETG